MERRAAECASNFAKPCCGQLILTEWSAYSQSGALCFLGLDWATVLPIVKDYLSDRTASFGLLSALYLSTVPSTFLTPSNAESGSHWLYEQYRRYAICVQDFGATVKEYRIPLIEATVVLSQDATLFDNAHPDMVSQILPTPTSTFRLIQFPQTRYSFIEDQVI